MERRKKIRVISFAVFFAVACIAWGISETVKAKEYKTQVNLAQQRALIQLCEYLDNIETDLTKTMYAGSGKMLASLSADLCTCSAGAKSNLSALSAGDTQLYNIYKFLSQVSDYTSFLNAKAAAGGEISAKELSTLKQLLSYAQSMSKQFSYVSELLNSRYLSFEELNETLAAADNASESTVSFISAVTDAEESMTDFPSLIYDGPFSDNVLNKESELLKGGKLISRTSAKTIISGLLGTEEKYIAFEGENTGRLASYTFSQGISRIAVTKNGGYLLYIVSDYTAGEEKLTSSDCIEKASAFLYQCGYKDMVSAYSASYDGVCTVNFAYSDGDYICYPDLIKVGVSLTDGSIVSLDASDYIMNHVKRDIPAPQISYEQARGSVPSSLKVRRGYTAVIPARDTTEKYAYELLCEDPDGRNVLIYIDTQTGETDDILILLYADGGMLTK